MKTKLLLITAAFFALSTYGQVYMYGTTYEGGANNLGTIYRVDQNGQNFQKVFDFTSSTGGKPLSGLTLAGSKLYGFTTEEGQLVNSGATLKMGSFFEFDPLTNNLTVIRHIDDLDLLGGDIHHAPILAVNGLLYAMSTASLDVSTTTIGPGNLFSYNPQNGTINIIASFGQNGTYGQCNSQLMQASNGLIYIITRDGGTAGAGDIITYDPTTNQLNTISNSLGYQVVVPPYHYEYQGATNNPLFEGSNGVLYGHTRQGGSNNLGVTFKIDLNGANWNKFHNFSNALVDEGFRPSGGFLEDNGFLYSSTSYGQNLTTSGTFYKINMSTDEVTFFHILDLEGTNPEGTFVKSPNGRFYITCSGINNDGNTVVNNGSILEYNPNTQLVTQRHSFSTSDGKHPKYNKLCLVDFSVLSINETSLPDNIVKIYPNPVNEKINIDIDKSYVIESIKILDMKGSVLYKDKTITNNTTVNTSFLTSGHYLLFIQTNKGSITKKILKE